MKRLILLLFLGCQTLCLAQSSPASPDAEALAGLTKLRNSMIDSVNKGDIEQLLTCLDPNVVVAWQNGEISHGPEEVRAYFNRMMKGDHPVVKEMTINPVILGRQINGDWAVSWGNLQDHLILNDGSDLPFNTLFTVTTAKRGDRWLVVSYHASVNAFDNPALTAAEHQTALWVGGSALALGLVIGLLLGRMSKRDRIAKA